MPEPQILYVDDEGYMQSCMIETFDVVDTEILTSGSGAEGLLALEKNPSVKVVISDYRMPNMNGIEFLSAVASRRPDTMRILISGFVEKHEIDYAIADGIVSHFIQKPWDITSILTLVSEYLANSDGIDGHTVNNMKFFQDVQHAA